MTTATPKPRAGEHTKGPWTAMHVTRSSNFGNWSVTIHNSSHPLERAAKAFGGSLDEKDIATANARRIVACVNFFEGIKSEDIESGRDLCADFKAERDLLRERERELVGLLELAERLRPAMLKSFGYVPEYVLDFCNRARALAKHGR